jgi:hypothetical protein
MSLSQLLAFVAMTASRPYSLTVPSKSVSVMSMSSLA